MTYRMLHVLEAFAPGGMETTFLRLLQAMPRHGVSHEVLAFHDGPLREAFAGVADGVHVTSRPAGLHRLLGDGWDVVHVLFDRCAYRLAPFLLGRTDAAFVYWKGYDLAGMFRVEGDFAWTPDVTLVNAADAALFTTPQLAACFDAASPRTTVLGKAADITPLTALPLAGPDTPLRILSVANLHPRKRLGDLIAALPLVRARVPGTELRLVGGGNPVEEARLRQSAADLGVAHAVQFAGVQHDIAAELAAARVLALPSNREGVPTVLLEAMAAGRPVVATPAGHTRSILDDGCEGYVVETGAIALLADRLVRVLSDPALAARLGEAGRLRAQGHGTAAVATRLDAVLRRAAAGRDHGFTHGLRLAS
ncbi:MAG: glycosyltransferase family 4 protein [Vicinamibacterales bacterium]|nr:glycosyltransferase family 4 protein [Vicinamibacterales bacterium]